MKLANKYFEKTLLHNEYRNPYALGFYDGMRAAVELLKSDIVCQNKILDEIKRDTPRDDV